MKIYVKIGTKKRFDDFKKIVDSYNINWRDGLQFQENFDEIRDLSNEPVGMGIDTETPHLEYARLAYYEDTPKYIHIKLADLEQFLLEVL